MELSTELEPIKKTLLDASKMLLHTFSFVPDDKLAWSPSSTARTPLWLVGHCGHSNAFFAKGILGEPIEIQGTVPEFMEMIRASGHATKSREEAIQLVETSTQEVLAGLDAMTPERYATAIDTPFGPMPMAFWVTIPGQHMLAHCAQLDYLQTIWGDLDDHMVF